MHSTWQNIAAKDQVNKACGVYPVDLRIGEGLHWHVYAFPAADVMTSSGQQGYLLYASLPRISCHTNKARLAFRNTICFCRDMVQV